MVDVLYIYEYCIWLLEVLAAWTQYIEQRGIGLLF